jgi:flavin reductase (DIM6/NTAB) family NADH-FMN oxidoreductase RutF
MGMRGERYGVTVNSFNSVSLDPPLVLFSLCRTLLSLDGMLKAGAFAINFLRDDQAHLSASFANARSDKWQDVEFRPGVTGSPVLVPALAVLECRPFAQYDGGDHVIVLGQVVHVEMDVAHHPLVFFRGRYHRLLHTERGQ